MAVHVVAIELQLATENNYLILHLPLSADSTGKIKYIYEAIRSRYKDCKFICVKRIFCTLDFQAKIHWYLIERDDVRNM